MSDFLITTDCGADLPEDYLKENDIFCAQLTCTICGETHGGRKPQLPYKEFYSLMRAGNLPKTSQVNPDEAKEYMLSVLEKTKKLLVLAFSSGLSGTYNSFRIAAEEINEERSDVEVQVVDSKCASLGQGLFVYKVMEYKKSGKSFEETAEYARKIAGNVVHVFTVDDLNHLYRGGRVSRTAAFFGTVLNIKPVLHVDDEGKLIPLLKERGRKKSLLKLVDLMGEQMGSYADKNDIVFISHGDCVEDAEFVRDEIKSRFGIEKFMINHIGPVIGAHAGPGTVALFFMGDRR